MSNRMLGFDMHVHSNASDGQLSPRELIDLARQQEGLVGIALTDHDTVDGLPAAQAYAAECDYPLIAGIELSAEYHDHDVHILGYWLEVAALQKSGVLTGLAAARLERCHQMVRRLRALGMPLDAEQIIHEAGASGTLGRPHLAKAMLEAGYVQSYKEAFNKWLNRGMPAYVPRQKLTPFEAIEIIRQAAGVAVLAHPGLGVPDYLIPRLARQGLAGVEVYHSEHNRQAEKKYAQIALRYRLAALGGSDFHLPGPRELGGRRTTIGQLERLSRFKPQSPPAEPSSPPSEEKN